MPIQKIIIPETLKVSSDGTLQFTVSYESDDSTVGSLSVGLYFDSTVLKLVELPDIYYRSLTFPNSLNDIDYLSRYDQSNFDQNPNTDKLFITAWSDSWQTWPGTTNVDLYTIKFQVQNGVDLNNLNTVINFTGNGANGFTLDIPTNVVISEVNQIPVLANQIFTLDENTANGTVVGTLNISDADDTIASLRVTDTSDTFDVQLINNQWTLVVANGNLLDFETTLQFIVIPIKIKTVEK